MFEKYHPKGEPYHYRQDPDQWAFDFLISIANGIQEWKQMYKRLPATVSISEQSYAKLCASNLTWWFKDGQLTDRFYGVKIVTLPWKGGYFSFRGSPQDKQLIDADLTAEEERAWS